MLKWAWVVICVCVVYGANPDVRNCTEFWFDQNIDHFNWATPPLGATTFKQRYYVYDKVYQAGGPIFFYAGNEGDVTLYANATGLMWENAAKFGALLLFAEHRYYGLSQPFGDNSSDHMHWLTHEQALADYAHLLYTFKQTRMQGKLTPTIVFGGSYGGMLSAWMRIKYPNIVDGAIAASAPILAFDGQNYDSRTYWQESYGVQSQLRYASNIVFSNGLYDPWSSAGVLKRHRGVKPARNGSGGEPSTQNRPSLHSEEITNLNACLDVEASWVLCVATKSIKYQARNCESIFVHVVVFSCCFIF